MSYDGRFVSYSKTEQGHDYAEVSAIQMGVVSLYSSQRYRGQGLMLITPDFLRHKGKYRSATTSVFSPGGFANFRESS